MMKKIFNKIVVMLLTYCGLVPLLYFGLSMNRAIWSPYTFMESFTGYVSQDLTISFAVATVGCLGLLYQWYRERKKERRKRR